MKMLESRLGRLEAAADTLSREKPAIVLYDAETGPPELDENDTRPVVIFLPRNGREAPDNTAD